MSDQVAVTAAPVSTTTLPDRIEFMFTRDRFAAGASTC
jgi:hypothetical protein